MPIAHMFISSEISDAKLYFREIGHGYITLLFMPNRKQGYHAIIFVESTAFFMKLKYCSNFQFPYALFSISARDALHSKNEK